MWAIMSRTTGNVEECTLRPLRKEAWEFWLRIFENMKPKERKKKIAWYKREYKAVKVTLNWVYDDPYGFMG
jgi:hypothetical protein